MDSQKIGTYIKEQLKKKNINQEKLADELGISSSAISQALSGKNLFDVSNLNILSSLLDIPLDTIVNAGEERETQLESMSKLSYSELLKKDPKKEFLTTTDSKGNDIFYYLLKHGNISVIREFKDLAKKKYMNNIQYLTLLVKEEDLDLIKFYNNNDYDYVGSRFNIGKGASSPNHFSNKLEEFSAEESDFLRVFLNCENSDVLDQFKFYFAANGRHEVPAIVYYAIMHDNVKIIEYYEKKYEAKQMESMYDTSEVYQRIYSELLSYAISHKSWNAIKHYYKKVDSFVFNNYFKFLVQTEDIDFINKIKNELKDKRNHGYDYLQPGGRFDNSKELAELVRENKTEMVKFCISFSDQVSLDKALTETKHDQVDIMKNLIFEGARFTHKDSYSGNHYVIENMTGLMKYILNELEKKK